MTASDIKRRFAEHFIDKYVVANEIRDLACSDIVVIDWEMNIREYEIKVSISDLRRELSEIEYVLCHKPREGFVNFAENKKAKHNVYLNGFPKESQWVRNINSFYCPATFSFLITEELYKKEKERIDRLPYGVMDSETFLVLKPAKHLKESKKSTVLQLWKIAHSQNYKLFGGKE